MATIQALAFIDVAVSPPPTLVAHTIIPLQFGPQILASACCAASSQAPQASVGPKQPAPAPFAIDDMSAQRTLPLWASEGMAVFTALIAQVSAHWSLQAIKSSHHTSAPHSTRVLPLACHVALRTTGNGIADRVEANPRKSVGTRMRRARSVFEAVATVAGHTRFAQVERALVADRDLAV